MTEHYTQFDKIDIDEIQLKDPVLLNNGDRMMYSINMPLIQIGEENSMKMLLNPQQQKKDLFCKSNYTQNLNSNAFLFQNLDPNAIRFFDKLKAYLFNMRPPPKKTKLRSTEFIIFEDSVNTKVSCKKGNEIMSIEDTDINIHDDNSCYKAAVIIKFVGMVTKKYGGIFLKFKIVDLLIDLPEGGMI
jgi:hypothetical protein